MLRPGLKDFPTYFTRTSSFGDIKASVTALKNWYQFRPVSQCTAKELTSKEPKRKGKQLVVFSFRQVYKEKRREEKRNETHSLLAEL